MEQKTSFWNKIWPASRKAKDVSLFDDVKRDIQNLFNRSFFQYLGGQTAQYDHKGSTYLEKGYKINPDVFAVVNQMCDKSKSVPYAIKKVADRKQYSKLAALRQATKGNYSISQLARKATLETKAYEDKEQDFPLEKPNPNSTWAEVIALYKLFLKTNGNAYFLKVAPETGPKKGVPYYLYVLPSHKMKIVIKQQAEMLTSENPIDYYMLIDGDQYIQFPLSDVIHIKTPNPFFDFNGSHLYGLSPMAALLKNLESSNEALENNVKMMKNSGVFGLITGKGENGVLDQEAAVKLKSKLLEMDQSSGRLSKIAALAASVEFTRLSLTTDELQPFNFLKYDQKQICNVFGWSDSLLNNDDGGKYDKQKEERKRVITDNILPDLILFQEKMTKEFIQKFPSYENSVWEFDISELPEMQEDIQKMVEWMQKAYISPNEIRAAAKYETLKIDGMDVPWVPSGLKRIDEVGITASDVEKSYSYLKNDIL